MREDKLQIASGLAKSASKLSTARNGGLFSGFQIQMGRKLQRHKDVRGAKAGGRHVPTLAKRWSRGKG